MSGIKVVPSVFVVIEKDNKFLLLRRAGTGYMDGWYDLPAGHLEDQEELKAGAARELYEEASLKVVPADLKLTHVYQNHTGEPPHYGYMFVAKKWSGEPKIMEPEKCDDIGWFSIEAFPSKTLPYTKFALKNLNNPEVLITYHGPGTIKP
jgi:ADP-ribose pyrophosphatase YjhB (NUDIX family)